MRNVCIVSNYNYEKYVGECLESLATQTKKFDLILIVDDGSTDNSREIISKFCEDHLCAQAIFKKNGGQLSCYHAALEFVGADDSVFCMDSDDLFPPDYLELVSSYIQPDTAEFIFVDSVPFEAGKKPIASALVASHQKAFFFSTTSALTRKTSCWIGTETSGICMKGSLFHKLLPYPKEDDYITRVDDLFIYGASILGAHKLYLPSLGFSYRIHGTNNFAGQTVSCQEANDWRLRQERLFSWYSQKAMLPVNAPLRNVLHESIVLPKSLRKRFVIPSPAKIFLFDLGTAVSLTRMLIKHLAGR